MRWVTTSVAVLLTLAGLASALFVHWLVGLFWVEATVAMLAVDRAVGLRAFVLTDTRRSHPGHTWPPSKSWIAQIAGAVVLGLAIGYLAIRTAEPLALLAAMMIVLGAYMLWAIPALKRRQQGSPD